MVIPICNGKTQTFGSEAEVRILQIHQSVYGTKRSRNLQTTSYVPHHAIHFTAVFFTASRLNNISA